MNTKEDHLFIGQQICAVLESRAYKNQYTQGNRRDQVDSGWSDCATYARYGYLQATGLNIGDYTAAQLTNNKYLETVDIPIIDGVPDFGLMLPGDLLFFRGVDEKRKWAQYVGHVETYIGNGRLIGHGAGKGGTYKNGVDYCKMRQGLKSPGKIKNRGLICVRRLRLDAPVKFDRPPTPIDEYKTMTVVTNGGTLNVRAQPNTSAKILAKLPNGSNVSAKAAVTGWRHIRANIGKQTVEGYVSAQWLK